MARAQPISKLSFGSQSFIGQQRAFFRRSNVSDDDNSFRLYTALGVQKSASDDEIKRQYYKLAKAYHPDVNKTQEAKKRYLEITEAYETLSDAKKRRVYDATGMTSNDQQNIDFDQMNSFTQAIWSMLQRGGAESEFDQSMASKSYEQILEEYERFFSLDKDVLQKDKQSNLSTADATSFGIGEIRGGNISIRIPLDFPQAYTGVSKNFSYDRIQVCHDCEGARVKKTADEILCPQCKGEGEDANTPGDVCKYCLGSGINSVKCETCHGDGILKQRVNLGIKIPKSVDDGMLLRIKDRGHQALNGRSGDLIVQIELKEHENFTRDGFDIHCKQQIAVTKAILGGVVEVQTLEGSKKIQLQPGTAHNQQYSIKGLGFEKLGSGKQGRGDMIVTFEIVIPKELTTEQKKAIESYAQLEDTVALPQ